MLLTGRLPAAFREEHDRTGDSEWRATARAEEMLREGAAAPQRDTSRAKRPSADWLIPGTSRRPSLFPEVFNTEENQPPALILRVPAAWRHRLPAPGEAGHPLGGWHPILAAPHCTPLPAVMVFSLSRQKLPLLAPATVPRPPGQAIPLSCPRNVVPARSTERVRPPGILQHTWRPVGLEGCVWQLGGGSFPRVAPCSWPALQGGSAGTCC